MSYLAERQPAPPQPGVRRRPKGFDDVPSLAQVASAAMDSVGEGVAVGADGLVDAVALYAALYRRHFDKTLYRRALENPTLVRTVYAVRDYCDDQGYDLATYVSAQMESLKGFVGTFRRGGRLVGFQPNMLLGRRAHNRFRAYEDAARKRYRAPQAMAFAGKSAQDRLVVTLVRDEVDVGGYYVRAHAMGEPVTWKDAVAACRPSPLWLALQTASGPVYRDKLAARGADWLAKLRRAVRLTAGVEVLNTLRAGLAARCGLRNPAPGLGTTPLPFWGNLAAFAASQPVRTRPAAHANLSELGLAMGA